MFTPEMMESVKKVEATRAERMKHRAQADDRGGKRHAP